MTGETPQGDYCDDCDRVCPKGWEYCPECGDEL